MQLSNMQRRTVTFPLQRRLRERAMMLRYTRIAYPVPLQKENRQEISKVRILQSE